MLELELRILAFTVCRINRLIHENLEDVGETIALKEHSSPVSFQLSILRCINDREIFLRLGVSCLLI
jgi:hypothetical protein